MRACAAMGLRETQRPVFAFCSRILRPRRDRVAGHRSRHRRRCRHRNGNGRRLGRRRLIGIPGLHSAMTSARTLSGFGSRVRPVLAERSGVLRRRRVAGHRSRYGRRFGRRRFIGIPGLHSTMTRARTLSGFGGRVRPIFAKRCRVFRSVLRYRSDGRRRGLVGKPRLNATMLRARSLFSLRSGIGAVSALRGRVFRRFGRRNRRQTDSQSRRDAGRGHQVAQGSHIDSFLSTARCLRARTAPAALMKRVFVAGAMLSEQPMAALRAACSDVVVLVQRLSIFPPADVRFQHDLAFAARCLASEPDVRHGLLHGRRSVDVSTGFFPHEVHGVRAHSAYAARASSFVAGSVDSARQARQFVTSGPLPFMASRTSAAN